MSLSEEFRMVFAQRLRLSDVVYMLSRWVSAVILLSSKLSKSQVVHVRLHSFVSDFRR